MGSETFVLYVDSAEWKELCAIAGEPEDVDCLMADIDGWKEYFLMKLRKDKE
jgi:hypothetical protein